MPTGDYDGGILVRDGEAPSPVGQIKWKRKEMMLMTRCFLNTDKCITSDLLKDIPLSGVLSGSGGETGGGSASVTIEPELVKGGPLPSPKEIVNGNIKTVTEYREEEDGRKVKIIRTFRIETRKASKAVARRKNWKKFGNSEFDAPGPNVATTTVSDDVFMTFITSKEDLNCPEEEDPMNKLKGQKIVSCRICKGDHWTTRCPYKDTLGPMQKELAEQLGLSTGEKDKLPGEPEPVQAQQSKTGKYVPPSLRDGASRRGESMQPNRRVSHCLKDVLADLSLQPGSNSPLSAFPSTSLADDNATIRVTNLSEDTRETDLQELFRPFGSISRIYLAKDKTTGQSKGFAFISFHRREDAARAIAGVSGFGYDHLILNVEWAKPSTN
ncbi:Eukaryotic translation initiation factor 3 subunit G [Varanus komodoensis]|nr:Eukaryotic translation initiation factor 3 subunit G [Varanus komodoensis]